MVTDRVCYEDIDKVICGFYDAALGHVCWETALDSLGDLLGGCAAGMSIQSQSIGMCPVGFSRLDQDYISIMVERYPTAVKNPMVAAMRRLPPAKAVSRGAVLPDSAYFSSGLYNDVFRPQQLAHAAVACVHKSSDAFVPLGLFSRSSQQEFDDSHFSALGVVLPHLEKALQVYLRIGLIEASRAAVEDSLDHLPFGILFLDIEGRVWRMNRTAETIVRNADGLLLRRGRLHAALFADDRALNDMILSALAAACEPGLGAGGQLPINRRSMATPLSMLVAPLPVGAERAGTRPGAVVFVSDPDARITPCTRALMELFGLTPAEANLMSLLATGLSVKEAASRSRIKVSTARLHLKRVFQKTGAARQSDLVRMALSSVASVGVSSDGDFLSGTAPRRDTGCWSRCSLR